MPPIYNAADSMIRAFQTGLMERRAQQDQAIQEEKSKIEMELLQHRIKQMKIEEKIKAWDLNRQGAEAEAAALQGQPQAALEQQARLGSTPPAQDLQSYMLNFMMPNQIPPEAARGVAQQITPTPGAPVTRPGLTIPEAGINLNPVQLPVQSQEQLTKRAYDDAMQKARTERVTLPMGARSVVGTEILAENPRPDDSIEKARYMIERERMRNERFFAEHGITENLRIAAEEALKDDLVMIETAAAPDPKELPKYQEDVANWARMTEDQKKANPGNRPVPPQWRMSPERMDQLKLLALNAYRKKFKMPTLSALPEDWQAWKDPGDTTPGAPPAPPAATARPSAPALTAPPPAGTVRMIAPDGTTVRDVPKALVDHFKKLGAALLEAGSGATSAVTSGLSEGKKKTPPKKG